MGKVIRLLDDGGVPDDNPLLIKDGHKPEIYSLGHRTQLGLVIHPATGELWAHENGPLGGDEVIVIRAGRNYGWPVVSYSRQYSGPRVAARPWQQGMEQAEIVWLPSVAPSGMTFYDGDRFPNWTGNLFVGSLRMNESGTPTLERIVFNQDGEEQRREWLLTESQATHPRRATGARRAPLRADRRRRRPRF